MTFDEARNTLAVLPCDLYAPGADLMSTMIALETFTLWICDHPEVPDLELLRLLDHGGVIAEFSARCLYLRTGRDDLGWKSAGSNGKDFIIDRADWENHLQNNCCHAERHAGPRIP